MLSNKMEWNKMVLRKDEGEITSSWENQTGSCEGRHLS